jgi:putative ABC transport system permease protein
MTLLVALRDLQWAHRRFAVAVAATALVFALGLLMSGVSASFDNEVHRTLSAIGADRWLVPGDSFGPFTGPTTMPAASARSARRLPGVRRADPIAVLRASTRTPRRGNVNLLGVVPGGVGSPAGRLAHVLERPGVAIVDASLGLKVGDRVDLSGSSFRVGAITQGQTYFAGVPTVVVSLPAAQRLVLDGRPLATAVVIEGRPTRAPRGFALLGDGEVRADLARPVAQAKQTISFIRMLLWAVGAAIIGAIVYLAALERLREFAALKAIGVSTRDLVRALAVQAAILSLLSALLAAVIEEAIAPAVAMSVEVSSLAFATLPVVAVMAGVSASGLAIRRALRADPALAFGAGR